VRGEGVVLKVLDLGLVRIESSASSDNSPVSSEERLIGTPDYMAPEQAADCHEADARADVYSLGCTLYHLLTGRPPFAAGSLAEKLAGHLYQEPPALASLRGDLPPGLSEVLSRMIAKQPAARIPSAAEVVAALAPFAQLPRPREQDRDPPVPSTVDFLPTN